MPAMILDESLAASLIAERVARGLDRSDEVWEGTYVMSPAPNNEHQWLVAKLSRCLDEIVEDHSLGRVLPGVNISDRQQAWESNYRIPDIAVFLSGTSSVDCGSHWLGGPDLAVEITSQGDRTHDKLDFYAKVGTAELLILDRNPWRLQRYSLINERMNLVGTCSSERPETLSCDSVSLQLTIVPSEGNPAGDRPRLLVESLQFGLRWVL